MTTNTCTEPTLHRENPAPHGTGRSSWAAAEEMLEFGRIAVLRRALGEDRNFIRTEFGRGHRFSAEVLSTAALSAYQRPTQPQIVFPSDRAAPTIGVIDDDRDCREALEELLRSVGLRAQLFASVQEFLDSARPDQLGCLVLDVRLPGRNGLDFHDELTKADVHVPVIFISGYADVPMSVRAMRAGAVEFLTKPVRAQNFLDAIQLAITRDRVRRERSPAPQSAEPIVSSAGEAMLESHRRDIVALFCDMRGFTAFAEMAEPEDVMAVLREYHGALAPLIHRHGGTLDSFIGDGMFVLFDDPVPCADPALRAVRLAVDMREAAASLGRSWAGRGHDIGFGVGVARGYATLGRIGFEGHFDYTAIGTVTNVAARLCAEAKDGQILVTQRVAATLDGLAEFEPLGDLVLKGLSRSVAVLNVLGLGSSCVNRGYSAPTLALDRRVGTHRGEHDRLAGSPRPRIERNRGGQLPSHHHRPPLAP